MRTTILAALGLTVALALSACAEEPAPPVAAPSASPTPSPSPTLDAAPTTFTQPALCSESLPSERIAELEGDRDLVLLGGPEGRYGLDYALDPSPEERAGGITCIWGYSASEVSSVTVSVAPLSAASRAPVIAELVDQGLNEAIDGNATIYWQEGDTEHQPAIINVIRADSWISVIQTIGGPDAYDDALAIAAEAYATVYR